MPKKTIVNLILATRIASAIYIFFNPVWGFILSLFFDWFDWYVLENRTRVFTTSEYQHWDKNVDWYMYIFMLLVGIRYGFFYVLLIFFLFKLIGHLIYLKTRNRKIFILFPNFLEGAFVWYIVLRLLNLQYLFINSTFFSGLVVLLVFELIKEIWMHFILPSYLDKFGYPKILNFIGVRNK